MSKKVLMVYPEFCSQCASLKQLVLLLRFPNAWELSNKSDQQAPDNCCTIGGDLASFPDSLRLHGLGIRLKQITLFSYSTICFSQH